MVVFTCNACGQSLKKNQVEKHYLQQCRNCNSLTCIDCLKDFFGDEYKGHIKCITEDERYGGKNFKPKESFNKGAVRQEMWIEHVKKTISTTNVSPKVSSLMEQLTEYSNIPRKKIKFENFLQNSLRIRDLKLVNDAWEIFSKSLVQGKTEKSDHNGNESCANKVEDGTKHGSEVKESEKNENNSDLGQKKKRKKSEENGFSEVKEAGNSLANKKQKTSNEIELCEEQDISDSPVVDFATEENIVQKKKFKLNKVIKNILRQYPNNEMSLKKLRKKALAEYESFQKTNGPYTKEQFLAKLEKKICDNSKFNICENKIQLSE